MIERVTRSRRLLFTALSALLLLPVAAMAGSLSINGVPIGKIDLRVQGLENMTFEKCTSVKVEPNGDVRIECPGYDLQAAMPSQSPPVTQAQPNVPRGNVRKHYWIYTTQTNPPGQTQFDVDLYINGKWVRRFANGEATYVGEISKYLSPGANKVILAGTKNLADGRKSNDPQVQYKFIIGEGDASGGRLNLTKILLNVARTAAEPENVNDEKEITVE